MIMFTKMRRFLSHHSEKLIIGSLTTASTILLVRYTQRKLREWQEEEAKKMLQKTKRRQYYESTERTCNQMISSLSTSLRKSVANALNIESILNELRSNNCDKVATWTRLKVVAITRSAVIIYSETMLAIFLTIQMNLMSGYMFKDSQNLTLTGKVNADIQASYISLCSYFINKGISDLCLYVEEKVNEITSSISLKDEMTLRDIEKIYWAVVSSISADTTRDPTKNLGHYILSPIDTDLENPLLKRMINETLDLLECEEVQCLVRSSMNNGFVLLIDRISEYFIESPKCSDYVNLEKDVQITKLQNHKHVTNAIADDNGLSEYKLQENFINFNTATMRMAKIIPIIYGQVPANSTSGDMPSHWLDHLLSNYQLKILGANIYEAVSF